jgi:hypothetical protein
MRKLAALIVVALAVAIAAGHASAAPKPRVTVIGDSVQASFTFVPAATARLRKGLNLKLDAVVCRRLVAASCTYNGVKPKTALQVVKGSTRARLGKVVVVNVGYNDDARVYNVNAVMRALRAKGVRKVVWVTLHDPGSRYRGNNAAIRKAAKRWKGLTIADWSSVSAGRPWFRSDGIHPSPAGAMSLSGLIRQKVLAAL